MTKVLAELVGEPGLPVTGSDRVRVTGIAYDSRKVMPGNLFVAIDGFAASGRDYISDAVMRGAAAVAGPAEAEAARGEVPFVRTDSPRRFLARVANRFYDFPARDVRCIGLVGTNGKTTTSYLIRSILEAAGEKSGMVGTIRHFNGTEWVKAENTTPESPDIVRLLAELRTAGIKYCVMEVSSHAIALDRVADLDFQVGVFTNLTQDHLDFHKTMDEYKKVKLQFFQTLSPRSWAVYNADDPVGPEIRTGSPAAKLAYRMLTRKSPGQGVGMADEITARVLSLNDRTTSVELATRDSMAVVNSTLIGEHNIYNLLAAAGVGHVLGLAPGVVKDGIERVKFVPGRMERVDNPKGLSVFVDFAHSPDALGRLIRTARTLIDANRLRGMGGSQQVIVVFGCGGDRDRGKRPLMGRIATDLADKVIVTSDNPRGEDPLAIIEEIKAGIQRSSFEVVPNRYAAIKRALFIASKGDMVLIAGKGHEDYQIIGKQKQHFDDRETVKAILG